MWNKDLGWDMMKLIPSEIQSPKIQDRRGCDDLLFTTCHLSSVDATGTLEPWNESAPLER